MQEMTVKIVGIQPLIMHNVRLADPLDELVRKIKPITSKKKKTEDDQLLIFRLEWEGGLYFDAEIGPYIPGQNVEATIKEAARLQRRGKDIERGMRVMENKLPLRYKGPRDLEAMYGRFSRRDIVRVNASRTTRCRPTFPEGWGLQFTVAFSEEMLNPAEIMAYVATAGRFVGLCDWRPRFGQFEVAA